ncbi:hypothetical protein [Roseococcus suduntuyensis]|uniref:Uncharacterized protein n=1 Tax=Roseococcus suduntuyensis TaxID=455361 RepID=A0A840AE45_9PROT|nr:hypothetical protein [Roseococcus suduntuyensis]MBB3899391.1 hypothetical protein [Roseococcus suduntuyensis]
MPPFLATPLTLLLGALALLLPLLLARAAGLRLEGALAAPANLVALLVFAVGIGFAAFLWWLASRSFALLRDPATTPGQIAALRDLPMGLPEGTVRALLALIVGIIGLPLLLFSQALALNDAVAGYVNGIIAGVFGYYFGARSTTPEAQVTRRLTEVLASEQRQNQALRDAPDPARVEGMAAQLERHLGVARTILTQLGPALPPGILPPQAATLVEAAERALGAARTLGGSATEAPLQAALGALTGAGGPFAALLRAAAPALPLAAGGPLGAAALVLGVGWNLGAGAWRRFRARLLEAPLDPALFDAGTITPASAELRLAQAPIFARLFTPRLEEPGFLATLLDHCLRPDAAALLWARHPGFASPEEAAQGLAEFRAALLEEALARDVTPETLARAASGLSAATPALRAAPDATLLTPVAAPPEARAALEGLTLLLAQLRETDTDPLPLLAEITP